MSLFRIFQLKNHISIPVAMEQTVSPGGKKSWHYIVEKKRPINVFFITHKESLILTRLQKSTG